MKRAPKPRFLFPQKAAQRSFKKLLRPLAFERLESRQLLDATNWTNPLQRLDVSGDASRSVDPLDALIIINEINAPVYTSFTSRRLPDLPDSNRDPHPYLDVDCDGFVSPLDVLNVVNAINSGSYPTGWNFESNSSAINNGFVSSASCGPKLHEGSSFTTQISTDVLIPPNATNLSFRISSTFFDTFSAGGIKDAFEASFVDQNGQTLVFPYVSSRDSFFNMSEGLVVATAPGVVVRGDRIEVNVSQVPTGTIGKLVIRLVNNDHDTRTSAAVSDLKVATVGTPVPIASTTSSTNPAPIRDKGIDFSKISDVTGTESFFVTVMDVNRPPVLAARSDVSTQSHEGTEFWLAFPGNAELGGSFQTPESHIFYISGRNATTGVVEVPGLSFLTTFSVTPGEITTVILPKEVEVKSTNLIESLGIHVTAEDPITIYGLTTQESTSDAYLGLPVGSLGTEYLALSYGHAVRYNADAGTGGGTQFTLVGTEDNTRVSIQTTGIKHSTAAIGLHIEAPDGTVVRNLISSEPSFEGLDYNFFGPSPSPFSILNQGGQYSVAVESVDPTRSGTVRFRWLDIETDAIPLKFGEIIDESLYQPGFENPLFSFDGVAGQILGMDKFSNVDRFEFDAYGWHLTTKALQGV